MLLSTGKQRSLCPGLGQLGKTSSLLGMYSRGSFHAVWGEECSDLYPQSGTEMSQVRITGGSRLAGENHPGGTDSPLKPCWISTINKALLKVNSQSKITSLCGKQPTMSPQQATGLRASLRTSDNRINTRNYVLN